MTPREFFDLHLGPDDRRMRDLPWWGFPSPGEPALGMKVLFESGHSAMVGTLDPDGGEVFHCSATPSYSVGVDNPHRWTPSNPPPASIVALIDQHGRPWLRPGVGMDDELPKKETP